MAEIYTIRVLTVGGEIDGVITTIDADYITAINKFADKVEEAKSDPSFEGFVQMIDDSDSVITEIAVGI